MSRVKRVTTKLSGFKSTLTLVLRNIQYNILNNTPFYFTYFFLNILEQVKLTFNFTTIKI